MINARARIHAHLNHWNMTTTETTAADPVTETQKDKHSFLGLYIDTQLKNKIAEKAKEEDRSMSKFASRVFINYFENQQ